MTSLRARPGCDRVACPGDRDPPRSPDTTSQHSAPSGGALHQSTHRPLRLAAAEPDLVPELVLVDVTPSAPERHQQMTRAQLGTVALVQGNRTFPSFAAMLDVTMAAAPHRDRKSLRRGVFHNSKRLDDGTWTWRYDSVRKGPVFSGFANLWDDVPAITMPTTLVRGAESFFVNDEDAAAFAKAAPGFVRTHIVADSGHSVQGDQPRALVDILRGVLSA